MSNMRAVFLSVFMFATMSIWAKAQLFVPGEDWSTSTDWSVSGVEWSSLHKMNYFTKNGAYAISPTFSFAITSIVITARNTNISKPRTLKITPLSSGTQLTENEWSLTPASSNSQLSSYTNKWDRNLKIDSFRIDVVNGDGNTHIASIELEGPMFIEPPTSFAPSNPSATRARISWKNPDNAASNSITVYEVLHTPESYTRYLSYDFAEITNTAASTSKIENFSEKFPDFFGEEIRRPASCTGMVQISGSESHNKGFLGHHKHDPYSELTLILSAKRYNNPEEAKTMTIDWIDLSSLGTVTNAITEIPLELELNDYVIPLGGVAAEKAAILLNAGGRNSKHRVIIDQIDFVKDYTPQSTVTNFILNTTVTARESFTIKGLSASKTYFAEIKALDEQGRESLASQTVTFTTAKSDGFALLLK